jgi:hypothetical protein
MDFFLAGHDVPSNTGWALLDDLEKVQRYLKQKGLFIKLQYLRTLTSAQNHLLEPTPN